ncbi:MAG: proton-conducting transporter membrane subunit [Opitutaceae bacterium]|nr:proton-conducting transporter membrane subunit [Opitutaceae bacterium]
MSLGPLLFSAALGQLAALAGRRMPRFWLVSTVLGAVAALATAGSVLFQGAEWEWRSSFLVGGEFLYLRLDGVSALFLALLAVLGGAGAVYASEYWPDKAHPRSATAGRAWWNVMLASLAFVLVTSNGLHFLLAWEAFTFAGYFLITLDRHRREVRAAGWLYLAASHAGTVCLFAFFAAVASHNGSWELGPMREHTDLAPFFWLALFGFGLKSGMFPLHIWLPSAHASAPSHVSALFSGVTIKIGIYGLVRFTGWMPVPDIAGWVIAALGVASAVLGVAFALGQHDLKRLLAYHSVENIGIILIGLGFAVVATATDGGDWGRLALAGGLLHIWNHGLFKALLFLGAGSVLHATGTREMSRLGGLWRAMPWTASLFALGAAAISGLPPLNGFVSEWLVYLGLFDGAIARGPIAWPLVLAAILLGVTGALALACFIKVCGVVFLGAPRSRAVTHAHESGLAMRAPMLVLAAGCVAIGLAPVVFWPAVATAVGAWRPGWADAATIVPDSLFALSWAHGVLAAVGLAAATWLWQRTRRGLQRAVTWDCGYEMPSATMQYTAGSFAGIITGWFAWILRPQRHAHCPVDVFPAAAHFEEHTPETVLEHVVEPAGAAVMRLATLVRRLQHGRLNAYLLYLIVGVAALAAVVLLEDRP